MIRRNILTLLSVLLPALLASQEFLIITADRELYTVNVDNCNLSLITAVSSPGNVPIGDITFTPNGTLWGIGTNGSLFTINLENGSTSLKQTFPFSGELYNAMVADATGLIYIANQMGDLYTYNPANGIDNYLGDVGPGAAGDLTFIDGELVMATVDNSMLSINLNAPSNSTVLLNFSGIIPIFGIVTFVEDCDNTTTFATSGSGEVYDINFVTGSISELCDLGVSSFGAASELEFLAADPIQIESVEVDSTSCFADEGYIEIIASSPEDLEYSLDGINFQADNTFSNLPEGTYTVFIQDNNNCEQEVDVEIFSGDAPLITDVIAEGSLCGDASGSLSVIVEGGEMPYEYQIDDEPFISSGSFTSLAAGTYDITVMDAQGCTDEEDSAVVGSICPIYIPTAFSPNEDGRNDRFQVYSGIPVEILHYRIFNRWGGLVYEARDFLTTASENFWDGTANGEILNPGLYVYQIRLVNAQGEMEGASGEVLLVR